eukprot:2670294-Pleurochrysis_carterae.AAC.2
MLSTFVICVRLSRCCSDEFAFFSIFSRIDVCGVRLSYAFHLALTACCNADRQSDTRCVVHHRLNLYPPHARVRHKLPRSAKGGLSNPQYCQLNLFSAEGPRVQRERCACIAASVGAPDAGTNSRLQVAFTCATGSTGSLFSRDFLVNLVSRHQLV